MFSTTERRGAASANVPSGVPGSLAGASRHN